MIKGSLLIISQGGSWPKNNSSYPMTKSQPNPKNNPATKPDNQPQPATTTK